ncbi:MAG: carbohydrate-binding protein [Acidobacteriota bacterium]|nr:carbohydrate-binding protein [Acidobacteriota bacterium]
MNRHRTSAILLAALLLAPMLSAQTVSVWLTTDDRKALLQPQPDTFFARGAGVSLPTLVIDDLAARQVIEGFGASMTDSSAYLLAEVLPAANLPAVMRSLFDHTQGIGVSFLRNPMGASDLSRNIYSYDDQPAGAADTSLAAFSVNHDRADVLPLLVMAKSINPQLKMMANPWSPPGWMKTSGSMIKGSLNASAYPALAQYFVKYLQAYASAGVTVDYISLQNEPLFVPDDYPGMSMSSAEQLSLLKNSILPALQTAGLNTKVLIYDHNWDQPAYPQAILNDAAVASSPNLGGIAWHWYGGTPGAMTALHNLHPGVKNFVTEASGGTWITDEVKQDFEMIVHSLRNWAGSYVKWGLALDQNHGPHSGGCGTCSPLVTIDSQTGAVSYTVDYYTLGHFSKFISPGSTAVWSSNAPGLISAAFVTPSHTLVLVAYNDSAADKTFQVSWRQHSFRYTLPALSGATFTWPWIPDVRGAGRDSIASARPAPPRLPRYTIAAAQQIQASSYTRISNLQSEPCTDTEGGFDIGYSGDGSWLEYDNIDFGSGPSAVDVRWASAGSGTLEFHLDTVSGPIIAQAALPVTGGWQTWRDFPVPVTGAQGMHKLYVVFRGGANGLGNLNWFRFR